MTIFSFWCRKMRANKCYCQKRNGQARDTITALGDRGVQMKVQQCNRYSEYWFAMTWLANGDGAAFESCYDPTFFFHVERCGYTGFQINIKGKSEYFVCVFIQTNNRKMDKDPRLTGVVWMVIDRQFYRLGDRTFQFSSFSADYYHTDSLILSWV